MNVERLAIRSEKGTQRPFYELAVSDGFLFIESDLTDRTPDLSGESVSISTDRRVVIGVSIDGDLVVEEVELQTKLAEYGPETDSLTVLEFEDQ